MESEARLILFINKKEDEQIKQSYIKYNFPKKIYKLYYFSHYNTIYSCKISSNTEKHEKGNKK